MKVLHDKNQSEKKIHYNEDERNKRNKEKLGRVNSFLF